MPPTKTNKQIMDIYKEMVDLHYYEREETNKVGSFQESEVAEPQSVLPKAKRKKSTCSTDEVAVPVRTKEDIRSFFRVEKIISAEKKMVEDVVIELSD